MLKLTLYKIYFQANKKGIFPKFFREWAGRHVDLMEQRGKKWIEKDPYRFDPPEWKGAGCSPYVLGIIKELWHQHWPFIAACRELGVSYKVLDITGPDWIEVIKDADCDAFLAWPSVQLGVWKQMYEERLHIISKVMHKTLFPTFEELWLRESKRRMYYWLKGNRIPHAKTWVFYDLSQALAFAQDVKLPIVYKSDLGSGSSGVIAFRDRNRLRKHIRMCFERGFTTYRRSPHDKDWRYVLLQEHLGDVREWRMLRIGDSFFGYQKLKRGEFHSGSGKWQYGRPPSDLLDFVKTITDKEGFRSMDMDIFVTQENRYFVNELQALFAMGHPYEMCVVNEKAGRMLYDSATDKWWFEEGNFCQNYLCNLRVEYLMDVLASRQSGMHSSVSDESKRQ